MQEHMGSEIARGLVTNDGLIKKGRAQTPLGREKISARVSHAGGSLQDVPPTFH
jgi:hypothetical protein